MRGNSADVEVVNAAEEIDLFFQAQLLEHGVDSRFDRRLRSGRRLAHRGQDGQKKK